MYCPYDPNSDYPEGLVDIKRSDVLRQSLRLRCVYLSTKEKTNDQGLAIEKFVGYAMRFRQKCTDSELNYTSSLCAHLAMKALEINADEVNECYFRQFGIDDTNTLEF